MPNTYYNHKVPGVGAAVATATNGVRLTSAEKHGNLFRLAFAFTAASITVTDAAGSGSSGSLKIFDFDTGFVQVLGTQHTWTAFAEGAALTGAAGDAAFVIAFGSAAANAGDGALTGTEVDFGATRAVTLSGGTGTGAVTIGTALTPLDGTATPVDLYINWSGSAATIDANSTISVTGTYTVWGVIAPLA
jgi:hypothetical protein